MNTAPTLADIKRLQPPPVAEVLAGLTDDDLFEGIHWGNVLEEKAYSFAVVINNICVDELTRRDDERDPHNVPLPFHLWTGSELGQALAAVDALATTAQGYGVGQLVDRLKSELIGTVMLRLKQLDNFAKTAPLKPEAPKNDNN